MSARLAKDIDADHLLFLILALSIWWSAVPQLARMITGSMANNRAEQARRRTTVVNAARRFALAPPTHSERSNAADAPAPVSSPGTGKPT